MRSIVQGGLFQFCRSGESEKGAAREEEQADSAKPTTQRTGYHGINGTQTNWRVSVPIRF
jgi:hypothetical protein